ncbi:hypothetical protein COOONC_09606 [Cooperia oncophora]
MAVREAGPRGSTPSERRSTHIHLFSVFVARIASVTETRPSSWLQHFQLPESTTLYYRILSAIPTRIYSHPSAMSMKRKSFFVKLMKLVGRGNQVQSSKSCLAQIYEQRKKQRQRSSLSSHLSHVEPMPTILEEDESLFTTYDECSRI